jgi:hypothetical protein
MLLCDTRQARQHLQYTTFTRKLDDTSEPTYAVKCVSLPFNEQAFSQSGPRRCKRTEPGSQAAYPTWRSLTRKNNQSRLISLSLSRRARSPLHHTLCLLDRPTAHRWEIPLTISKIDIVRKRDFTLAGRTRASRITPAAGFLPRTTHGRTYKTKLAG